MSIADLPHLNATLNVLATILLLAGWLSIRARRTRQHVALMVGAFLASTAFLVSYLVYHYNHTETKYTGEGALRTFYFVILASHIILAVLVPPMAIRVLWLAGRRRWSAHVRWARITFPVWLYVSVTGVIIYLMLYVFPPAGVER
ncbi:MAG TPA: DUF420 domain-containing protein [Planctomycetota bacterium]|nr:DUF420 domain-containing protein [Planctomycetota bacterium]